MKILSKLLFLIILLISSCQQSIVINNVEWAKQDLDTKTFSNGDEIPYVESKEVWSRLTTPAWTYYNNDSIRYGAKVLYNWYAIHDARGICPEGWSVPSLEQWEDLIHHFGGKDIAAKHLKGKTGWSEYHPQKNKSNNFNIYPSGNRKENGMYNGWGLSAPIWTSDSENQDEAWAVYVNAKHDQFLSKAGDKKNGLLCRCVRISQ